jgi:membrane associated rhomboid family serine protease
MIQFDDPSIHVATDAHIASAVFGVGLWWIVGRRAAAGRRK